MVRILGSHPRDPGSSPGNGILFHLLSVCSSNFDWVLSMLFVFSFSFLVGLAYQGKDIVLRFIIEYSSLMDSGTRSIFIRGFSKDDVLACVET